MDLFIINYARNKYYAEHYMFTAHLVNNFLEVTQRINCQC